MIKIFLSILFILLFNTSVKAVNNTAAATEYSITMTFLELCETGSTLANCLNPIVLGSGDSGLIDIANTTAGAAATSFGSLSSVVLGKTYTHMQVTMKRAIQIAGTVSDGSNTCRTTSDSGDISKGVVGATSGTIETVLAYMGQTTANNGDAVNSTSAADGTGTNQDAGTIDDDDEYMEWRGALTTPFTLKSGIIPTVKVAFGTANALGYSGSSGGCTATIGESQGIYGSAPDVIITFE